MLPLLSSGSTLWLGLLPWEYVQLTSAPPYSTLHRVGKQIVNVPSFVVRLDSQKHIDFALKSPYGGGRPGRVKRKRAKMAAEKEAGGDEEEEEEE